MKSVVYRSFSISTSQAPHSNHLFKTQYIKYPINALLHLRSLSMKLIGWEGKPSLTHMDGLWVIYGLF